MPYNAHEYLIIHIKENIVTVKVTATEKGRQALQSKIDQLTPRLVCSGSGSEFADNSLRSEE
jgi:hypothetical protein